MRGVCTILSGGSVSNAHGPAGSLTHDDSDAAANGNAISAAYLNLIANGDSDAHQYNDRDATPHRDRYSYRIVHAYGNGLASRHSDDLANHDGPRD
jgi:hypothetical protein